MVEDAWDICLGFLGEILAKQFASLGAKLILSARNEAELVRVKNEISSEYFEIRTACEFQFYACEHAAELVYIFTHLE